MLAAEAVFEAFEKGEIEAKSYEERFKSSWIYQELHRERNVHAYFSKFGLIPGIFLTGLDSVILRGKLPFNLRHTVKDNEATLPKSQSKPIGMMIYKN